MRRVLIIGGFFPYTEGSRRVMGLAKYLPEYGWQPAILTTPLQEKPSVDVRVIEAQYKKSSVPLGSVLGLDAYRHPIEQIKELIGSKLRKPIFGAIRKALREVVNYPDAYKYWFSSACEAGCELLGCEVVDAMISTWPVTSHLVAKALQQRYEIPWITDLPDLWTQNHNYSYSRVRRLLERRLERRTLARTGAIVTVSEPWAAKLRKLHRGKNVYTVPHGFDPLQVNSPPERLTEKFTITYTGSIYSGKQDPVRVLVALHELISEGALDHESLDVRFYGRKEDWLENEISRQGLTAICKQYGQVALKDAIGKQRESQVLLLLRWEDPNEIGTHTGKIYEYLAARRPILATGGFQDVVEDLLRKTGAGVCASTVAEVKKAIRSFYEEYRLNGQVSCAGESTRIEEYSEREMARKFAVLLANITGN